MKKKKSKFGRTLLRPHWMVLPARLGPQATSWLSLLLVVHLQLCLKQHYYNYILDTFVSCL